MNACPHRGLRLRRSTLFTATLGVLVLTLLEAPSWACAPQPFVTLQPGASGPPGTAITIAGRNFGSGIVEVRWNAFDGSLLASTQGPEFTASASIPQAADGLYNLIIFRRDVDNSAGLSISAPFQVTRSLDPSGNRAPARSPASGGGSSGLGDHVVLVALFVGGVLIGLLAAMTLRRDRRARVNSQGKAAAPANSLEATSHKEDVDARIPRD